MEEVTPGLTPALAYIVPWRPLDVKFLNLSGIPDSTNTAWPTWAQQGRHIESRLCRTVGSFWKHSVWHNIVKGDSEY